MSQSTVYKIYQNAGFPQSIRQRPSCWQGERSINTLFLVFRSPSKTKAVNAFKQSNITKKSNPDLLIDEQSERALISVALTLMWKLLLVTCRIFYSRVYMQSTQSHWVPGTPENKFTSLNWYCAKTIWYFFYLKAKRLPQILMYNTYTKSNSFKRDMIEEKLLFHF